jgi:hypothetical protein
LFFVIYGESVWQQAIVVWRNLQMAFLLRALPRAARGLSRVATRQMGSDGSVSTLPNGIRVRSESFPPLVEFVSLTNFHPYNYKKVATEERPGETATIAVFVDVGSRFETEKNNGAAHFLEHLAFKVSDDWCCFSFSP